MISPTLSPPLVCSRCGTREVYFLATDHVATVFRRRISGGGFPRVITEIPSGAVWCPACYLAAEHPPFAEPDCEKPAGRNDG